MAQTTNVYEQEVLRSARKVIFYKHADPETALLHARKVLENILRDVYESKFHGSPRGLTLRYMLNSLGRAKTFTPTTWGALQYIKPWADETVHNTVDEAKQRHILERFIEVLESYFKDYKKIDIPTHLVEPTQFFGTPKPVKLRPDPRDDMDGDEATRIQPRQAAPSASVGQAWQQSRPYPAVEQPSSDSKGAQISEIHSNMITAEDAERLARKLVKEGRILIEEYLFGEGLYSHLRECEEKFRQAISLDPLNPRWHHHLSETLRYQDREAEAVVVSEKAWVLEYQAAKEALSLNPKDATAHHILGCFYEFQLHNYAQAEKEFRIVCELEPDVLNNFLLLASSLSAQKKHQEAESVYRRLIERFAQCAGLYTDLATCLCKQSRFREAEEQYLEAIRHDPLNDMSYCYFLIDQKRYDEAEELCRVGSRLRPKSTYTFLLADVKRARERNDSIK